MATNTYPVLVDPSWLTQTEIGVGGPLAGLVDRHDQAIYYVTEAMLGAMALYRERQRGR